MTTTRLPARRALGALAALGLAAAPAAAWAEESAISISVPVEVQLDHVSDADDNSEGTDLTTTIEPEITVGLSHGLSLVAGLVFEPVKDRLPGTDRAFKNNGLYVQTLMVAWEAEPFTLHAGKFTPVFGFDGDHARGMYADTFLGDYELTERLGFGGSATLPIDGVGDVTVAASLFTRDRSPLAGSIITDRGRLAYGDGTPGNTDSLENGTIAVDFVPAHLPDLLVRASYLHQGKGLGDTANQDAYGLGADYSIEVADGVTVAPMVDWVRSHDAVGFTDGASIAGARTDTITTGVQLAAGPWYGTLTQGWRTIDDTTPTEINDRFTQITAGYEFDFGLAVEAGWMGLRDGGVDSTTVGFLMGYGFEF
ncbi:hypothetical protein ACM64Y_17100 [Novispirillum sp. DQ9]|uniref:hypothetical protein n=1 Tax=Novispirillum sp. DQ9 TaxID=3398612 RepID=UPI003C7A6DF8